MKKGILKSKNGIMLITLGVVVIMVILIAVIGSMNQGGESVPTIETVAVTKGNVTQEVDASGNVESEQKKTFFSPVNGEIQTMPVEAGDTVEAGQPIIGFNLETLEREIKGPSLMSDPVSWSLQMPSSRRQTLRQNRKRLRPGSRSWRRRSQRNRTRYLVFSSR